MNPPGGISLIVHILIVIFGAMRRFINKSLKRFGVADSKTMFFLKGTTHWLDHALVQRMLAYTIITTISLGVLFSVFIISKGIIGNQSNINFITHAISAYKK